MASAAPTSRAATMRGARMVRTTTSPASAQVFATTWSRWRNTETTVSIGMG